MTTSYSSEGRREKVIGQIKIKQGRKITMDVRLDDVMGVVSDIEAEVRRLRLLVVVTREQLKQGCLRDIAYDDLKPKAA